MLFQAWILVALAVSHSLASPFRRHFKRPKVLEVEVDCNDTKRVQKLDLMRIKYKCFEGTNQYVEIILEPEVLVKEKLINRREFVVSDTDIVKKAIANSIENCSHSKRCKETLCEPDHVYAPSIKKCVPRTNEWAFVAVENQENEYYNRNFDIVSPSQCKGGYAYHAGLARCLPQNHYYFQRPINSQAPSPSYTFIRCAYNFVFVSEIGLCIPHVMVEKPQMDAPITSSLITGSRRRCSSGFLYSPEIDMCVPFKRPSQHAQGPTSLSLVKDKTSNNAFELLSQFADKHKCKSNEFYMSELDICIAKPQSKPVMQNDSPAVVVTTTEKPFRLTLSPGTEDQVGKSKCSKGQVYISEIDICVDN